MGESKRTELQVIDLLQDLLDIVALAGFVGTITVVLAYLNTSSKIVPTSTGVTIQGVPFAWIFWLLVATAVGSALRGLRAVIRILGIR